MFEGRFDCQGQKLSNVKPLGSLMRISDKKIEMELVDP